MKKILIFLLFFGFSLFAFSQSHLGWITKQVNFRVYPSKDSTILSSLEPGTQIFIVSLETVNDFYNIIDIETNTEGYVHKNFVKVGILVEVNDQGVFIPSGETSTYNPDAEIFNNTNLTMTLKLNSLIYTFSPHEKRTLSLSPGAINYRASAPGVIPNIGTEYLKNNQSYSWEFYIITTYH